jgi:hypothetical protein
MSTTVEATAAVHNAGTFARLLLWLAKTAALWIALLVSLMVAGKLVPVDMPMPRPDGPLTTMQALLVVNGLTAVALGLVAALARVRGWRLGVVLFVAYFGIGSAMMQIETLWFNDSIHMAPAVIGQLVADAAIVGALVALVGMLLFRPIPQEAEPVPANLAFRIGAMALIYVVLYYGAGFFIAWQSEAVRAYYDNGSHISLLPTVGFQIFRGTLWAMVSLFILAHLKGSLASRALVMAVLFAVMTDAQLLYPNPLLPWAVRQAHLVEVGTSEFIYGIVTTLVLLAGAVRRPLSAASRWRLIAGQA